MAMDFSYSQTPNSVWWALEASHSLSTLNETDSPPTSPFRHRAGTALSDKMFYEFADEVDGDEDEKALIEWMKEYADRGVLRVYQPGSTYSDLVRCTVDTTAETVMAKCFSKELFVHYGSTVVRRVHLMEKPLELQESFLKTLGHSHPHCIRQEGMNQALSPMFKFVAGQEKSKRLEDGVQLACTLQVKELGGIGRWSRRFCVLCGARLFIFASRSPKGKPTTILDLFGGTISEHKTRKYLYCLKISAGRKEVILAFESGLRQSEWLERAAKVLSRHPLEANLAGYSLEMIPKYFFLNYHLVAINLTHNFMQESFEESDVALMGGRRTIGWISDLAIFHHLVSLSLSDNDLDQFPISLCGIPTLQELDLSRNRIQVIPSEIQLLENLTTLLLHSNQLTDLPYDLCELSLLSTLVIAFNRFFDLPEVVKSIPSLVILVASGNYISVIPEDIHAITSLQHFDVRLNKLRDRLPQTLGRLNSFIRLNVRGNGLSELDTTTLPYLELLNCSENALGFLNIGEGPLRVLSAKSNQLSTFSVASTCEQLVSIDLSSNQLTDLPSSVSLLPCLERLLLNDNKLIRLPTGLFTLPHLRELRAANNQLMSLPTRVPEKGSQLEIMDLHCNNISILPPQLLTQMKCLQILNLSGNQLSTLPPAQDSHSNVIEFYASKNNLTDTALTAVARYKKLKILHLAFNHIASIPEKTLTHLRELEYLNLSGNPLSVFPHLPPSSSLSTLLMHSTQLSSLNDSPRLWLLSTLDLGCNKFTSLPPLEKFPRLKVLDLSGNSSMRVDSQSGESLKLIQKCVMEGVPDIHSDAKALAGKKLVTTIGKHSKWTYGSAHVIGTASEMECTVQVKAPALTSRADAVFAVIDGGRSVEAPQALSNVLAGILEEELGREEKEAKAGFHTTEPLQYLSHTFLAAHRELGEIGQKYGCSIVLCHIHPVRGKGAYHLNIANTGLGEAILCRNGHAIPLTVTHSPASNPTERTRVVDAKGFISQDSRVNGVCGASRLIGCYHLWPQVVPAPSTQCVELRPEDEHIVIATDGLWKFVSHEEVVQEIQTAQDPILAARRLRDLAVAYGCNTDVSVLVVKLNMFERTPKEHSVLHIRPMKTLPRPINDDEEEDEDEMEFTNIDDILSDTEDDLPLLAHIGSATNSAKPKDPHFSADIMDQMILSAITTPPSSPYGPTVKSTNIDDLLGDSPPPTLDFAISKLKEMSLMSAPQHDHTAAGYDSPQADRLSGKRLLNLDSTPPSRTLPRDAPHKRASIAPLNAGFSIVTSFEQTQSSSHLHESKRRSSDGDSVEDPLSRLNRALSLIQNGAGGTVLVDEPMGGRERRLSYVERSYQQLTSETYSRDSLAQATMAAMDVDEWA